MHIYIAGSLNRYRIIFVYKYLNDSSLSLLLLRITEMETSRVGGSVAVYLLED